MSDIPVLLLVWRRKKEAVAVVKGLRSSKPSRIYVASDGPRNERTDEVEKISQTRKAVLDAIDWPCVVETRFNDTNMGCRKAVSSAISWFFEHEEAGIILEDDCVPGISFYSYCSELLTRYQEDKRIWCISGHNFVDQKKEYNLSYYFSAVPMIWGWATWRDRWIEYDNDMNGLEDLERSEELKWTLANADCRKYWLQIWARLKNVGIPDSWAYRWAYTCILNGGLSVIPYKCLVQNIGDGQEATHTKRLQVKRLPDEVQHPLKHPSVVLINRSADDYVYENHFRRRWNTFPLRYLRFARGIADEAGRIFREKVDTGVKSRGF